MTTVIRLAIRLGLSSDPRQRWRQASIVVSACLAVFVLAMAAAVVAASQDVENRLSARMPISPVNDASESVLTLTPRGFTIGDRDVFVRWLDPATGHEDDPVVVPPGLRHLPGPGEAVLSPGLLRLGIGPEDLGFRPSTAGAGPHGSIGPDGVGTQDELIVWARPDQGRHLAGAGIAVVRFPLPAEATKLENHDDVLADYPMPRLREIGTVVLAFFVLPALLMLGLSSRARSELRTERSEFLLRLGVSRAFVRGLLGLEGAMLGVLGAAAGVIAYGVVGPRLTTIPLTGTEFLPGALRAAPGALVGSGLLVIAVVASVAASGRLEPSLRQRPARQVSRWRMTTLALGLVSLAGSAWLGTSGAPIFALGVVLVAVGLPLAAPALAQMAGARWRRTRPDPAVWMASAKVVHDPQRSSRVAALLGLAVFLGATSVAIYVGPMGGVPTGTNSAHGGVAAYAVDWLEPQGDDFETLSRQLRAVDGTAVVLPVGIGPDEVTQGGQAVGIDDCGVLQPLAGIMGTSPCDPDGALADDVRATFREAFSLEVVEASDLVPADNSGGSAPISGALVLADHSMSGVDMYRAGASLPGFNPTDLMSTTTSWGAIAGWISAGWAVSVLVLGWAILRDLIEHARTVQREAQSLVRVGLAPSEAMRVGRWTLLVPVVATVPVSFLCGLLASFFGTGPEITSYTPTWITLYTAVALTMTGVAAGLGTLMARWGHDR